MFSEIMLPASLAIFWASIINRFFILVFNSSKTEDSSGYSEMPSETVKGTMVELFTITKDSLLILFKALKASAGSKAIIKSAAPSSIRGLSAFPILNSVTTVPPL